MLNQIILVGRLVKDLEVKNEEGNKKAELTLAIPRSFKNENGEYDTDFISCRLFGVVAENTAEYCSKGDIIGIKGRLQSETVEDEEGNKKYVMAVIAEKVTFLSSRSSKENDEDEVEE